MNIGIIGCGKIAQVRHIPEYAENPNATLVGFFDLNKDRARELAQEYGGKAYDSIEDLFNDPDIEAVSVCTSNNTHAAISIQGLEAGKNVLCEKPMATTLADCEEMVRTAKKTGKSLMIGHNQRLLPAHIKARELIKDGAIGNVITFRTAFGHGGPEKWSIDPGPNTWFFDRKMTNMGALADVGIHKVDLIHFLTDQKITEVTAKVETLDKRGSDGNLIQVDDNAICIFRTSGGAFGSLIASWTYYGKDENYTVLYGTQGILRIYDDPNHPLVKIDPDGTVTYIETDDTQLDGLALKSGLIDAWISALMQDSGPALTGEDALASMRAVFACFQSSEEGRTIDIPQNRV